MVPHWLPQIWFFYIVPHCTFIIWADKTQESLFFNLALPCTHAYHFILSITLTLKPKYIQYSTTSFYFHCPGSRLNYWTEMTSLQFYFMIWKTCHVTIMFYQTPDWSLQSSSQFGSWLLLSQNYQMSHTSWNCYFRLLCVILEVSSIPFLVPRIPILILITSAYTLLCHAAHAMVVTYNLSIH